jgi:hypothetical protein
MLEGPNKRIQMHLRRLIQTCLLAAITTGLLLAPAPAAARSSQQNQPLISEYWFQRAAAFSSSAAVKSMRTRHAALAKLGEATSLASTPIAIHRDELAGSGGFHWADAGVGVGTAFGVFAAALGVAALIRGRRLRHAQGRP